METPEKIYIVEDRQKHEPMEYWYNSTTDDSKIEYTRTDVFIEKVENFLEMLGYGFTITDNITHADYDKEQLIEDFRKYIEEE